MAVRLTEFPAAVTGRLFSTAGLIVLFLVLGVLPPGIAAPASYSASNETGNFWDRPNPDGTSISGLGPVQYHVQPFVVSVSGLYDITSSQDYDGYLYFYEFSFDPLDQPVNLLGINDDKGNRFHFNGDGEANCSPGTGARNSELCGVSLTGGRQYILVTTAFSRFQTGNFSNVIEDHAGGAQISLSEVPPDIVESGVSHIDATTASFEGVVNPSGSSIVVRFEYGESGNFGSLTPAQSIDSGSGVSVTHPVSSLACGTRYHYRLRMESPFGVIYGAAQEFTTASCKNMESILSILILLINDE
ncbi:MAG: hypothetical protein GY703_06195 [Gammaproteobacteria bacterium]|nr:hypothetical protein [Gammaproteobacteria bacterium]